MFGEDFFQSLEEEEKEPAKGKHVQTPPQTRIEWMERQGLDTWPVTSNEDQLKVKGLDDILGELDNIKEDLMSHAPWESGALDNVDNRMLIMEDKLSQLSDSFLYDKTTGTESTSDNGGLSIISRPTNPQVFCNPDLIATMCKYDSKDIITTVAVTASVNDNVADEERIEEAGDRKNVQQATFIGFSDVLAPSLPNKLESLPLLDLVSKLQNYPMKFQRIWKKLFSSDISCSILQCAFWWIWMELFKPQAEQQARLYTLMAEKFSLLLLHCAASETKDELFQDYPKCLSQAVFAVFCRAFPKSVNLFHTDKFVQKLCDYIYEWTTGIPSQLGGWKEWSMEGLDPSYTLPVHAVRKLAKSQREEEEPCIGPGPTFECVQFVTSSQSPLLRHHLLVHRLYVPSTTGPNGPLMSRTQMRQQAPPSMTFKDLMKTSKDLSEKRIEAYERQMLVHQKQLNEALAECTTARKSIQRETKKLLSQRYEVSQEAEQIMNRYIPQAQTGSHLVVEGNNLKK